MQKLTVYTSTVDYDGPDKLDITAKSGGEVGAPFAPSWALVMEHRTNQISWRQYVELYAERMRASYRDNRDAWNKLLERDRVVLCCYCKPGSNCHRYLLTNILKIVCESRGINFEYGGEK